MAMLLLELSMYPLGKGERVGPFVSRALDIIDKSGLDYRLNSMGTVIEGEWDQVMDVAKKCFDVMKQSSHRIEFTMKGDWRKGLEGRISSKVETVEKSLGRKLKK
jgi:uncharacterized protein (TIGR00106 family)